MTSVAWPLPIHTLKNVDTTAEDNRRFLLRKPNFLRTFTTYSECERSTYLRNLPISVSVSPIQGFHTFRAPSAVQLQERIIAPVPVRNAPHQLIPAIRAKSRCVAGIFGIHDMIEVIFKVIDCQITSLEYPYLFGASIQCPAKRRQGQTANAMRQVLPYPR